MIRKIADRIDSLLTALENVASAPIVPGDLRAWCESVGNAFGALGEEWARKDDELRATFNQIEKEDLELAPRVQKMREKRQEISVEFVRLERMFAKLLKVDAEDPQGSSEPTSVGERVRQDVLRLALRCRTLDKEATTWFIEATHRDRGTGD